MTGQVPIVKTPFWMQKLRQKHLANNATHGYHVFVPFRRGPQVDLS